jgi:hypothetical protein
MLRLFSWMVVPAFLLMTSVGQAHFPWLIKDKDVEVKLYCAEGHEEGSAKTDGEGKVSFTNKQVEDGLNGIMLGTRVEESGELDGKPYTKAAHYLTTTFFRPESQAK